MNLHEYQSKKLLAKYNIPIPKGYVCASLLEIQEACSNIDDHSWVIKCQVHAGGRGKAGAVKILKNLKEICVFFEKWHTKRLITDQTDKHGQLVNKFLVEEKTDIDRELYLSATIDRETCRIVFIASMQGGVEIENVAKKIPNVIYKVFIDPLTGPQRYQGRGLGFKLGLVGEQINQFTNIFMKLSNMFVELDLMLIEINPLIINLQGNLICLDSKLSVDSNALFRHPELNKLYDITQQDQREAYATQFELNYISLEGDIGCIVNGAGLAMGTMDIIKYYGGKPANFLDVGGSVTEERVIEAFKIILSDINIKSILVNIFGGIVRCDLIANGIIDAMNILNIELPVIIRLEGNNSELAQKKLINSRLKIIVIKDLSQAVKCAVSSAAEQK
ncbi:ADP-forming succinate--CoA ligase subunit beta [Candidatus Pantoea edessiphila]|uniref:Succinate--CoA ligase [ADP-forming] subunit beta n=1 Tax=Candidatus Pantoea edessiphila TaxID=2044610 RepID=A0A2P5SZ38_9GAMM|nr:ADP-forming succinate--CoA ligase subunit beta [Candidatus Pantoea edessiphila]MBK4775302.1 ADP-forming succinate--CoA ligase subunit beta [Pantoea sp. Edef]PPI87560.1 ADP-forming succinate--CoA ligase subunit beta [Candidatus Pantoea edessiphila]